MAHAPRRVRASATDDNPVARAVNWLSVAVKNSPANAVKQAIAKAQAGDYDEAQVAARLESYIEDNKVVVFSWTSCPFCKKAKALLRDLGADFLAVELDQMGSEGSALRCELAKVCRFPLSLSGFALVRADVVPFVCGRFHSHDRGNVYSLLPCCLHF